MEHRHGFKMPSKDQSAVNHYHFHYVIEQKEGKEKLLSRVASDKVLQSMKVNHEESDKQSTSSHQSWKRLINPAFQAEQTNKVRSFKSTSPTAKNLNFNLQLSSLKLNQLNSNEKRGYMTPKTDTKRDRAITNTTLKNRHQESQELPENSFISLGDQHLLKINPQNLQKSLFSKKNAIHPLQEDKQQRFQGEQTKISRKQRSFLQVEQKQPQIPSQYAYTLLKQQAKYLRRTFLKHYIKNHLLKEENQAK